MLHHLDRCRHVPTRQRPLRTRTDRGREDGVGHDGQVDVRSARAIVVVVVGEDDRQRGFESDGAGDVGREDVQRSEHVFVGLGEEGSETTSMDGWMDGSHLVIARTKDKLCIGVHVQNPLDDLALDGNDKRSGPDDLGEDHNGTRTLFTANGRTSRFFFPTSTSMGRLCAKLFSNKSWHCLHWNNLVAMRSSATTLTPPAQRENSPPLGIARSVMPRNRALLHLDMTPRRPLRIIPKDLRHLVHPPHIQLCRKIDPGLVVRGHVAVGWLADEPTVLGAHTEVFNVAEVLLQERLITTRDDVDDIPRISGELRERVERIHRRNRHRRRLDDRRQRPLNPPRRHQHPPASQRDVGRTS